MNAHVNTNRLAEIIELHSGGHDENTDLQMCAMEAVAYVAGEPWSDHPACACPVISAFMRAWNDGLNDHDRNEILLPYIGRLVGTKSTKEVEERRALMAADWLVRVHTPAWLRLAGLTVQADALSGLPENTNMAQVPSIRSAIEAARDSAAAARDAAWDAAWDAARDAAWEKLRPTVDELKASARLLLDRMLAVTEPSHG